MWEEQAGRCTEPQNHGPNPKFPRTAQCPASPLNWAKVGGKQQQQQQHPKKRPKASSPPRPRGGKSGRSQQARAGGGEGRAGAAVPGPSGSAVVGTHRVASGARWAQLPGETCR